MALFLIRHGETQANTERVVQRPDAPLSERGHDQAKRLAARLSKDGVSRIFSSDLVRARATAEYLADATGAALELLPELQERNFGELRGRPYSEVGQRLFAPDFAPPGGESWEVFFERVGRAWTALARTAQSATGNLAIVTHGLVCYALATRHFTPNEDEPVPQRFDNSSLTVVDPRTPWRIRLLNCTAHLDRGLSADGDGVAGI